MRLQFDNTHAPPTRIYVVLEKGDVEKLKAGAVLEIGYQTGYGIVIGVKADP